MESKANKLSERLLKFGLNVIEVCSSLNRSYLYKHISNQLLRSGTSAGANYEEARASISKSDFIYKLHLVLKELRESLYWLKLLKYSSKKDKEKYNKILDETFSLCRIIHKSILTSNASNKKR